MPFNPTLVLLHASSLLPVPVPFVRVRTKKKGAEAEAAELLALKAKAEGPGDCVLQAWDLPYYMSLAKAAGGEDVSWRAARHLPLSKCVQVLRFASQRRAWLALAPRPSPNFPLFFSPSARAPCGDDAPAFSLFPALTSRRFLNRCPLPPTPISHSLAHALGAMGLT